MEQFELDLIEEYKGQDQEVNALWEEHVGYEKQLERFSGKSFLTPEEDLQIKEIKKMKLAGKTKLQGLLDKYKKEA